MIRKLIRTILLLTGLSLPAAMNAQTQVTAKGNPVTLSGTLPTKGTTAPPFTGVDGQMQDITLGSLKGKRIVLNIFPSLDTPTCALSVRRFNELAASLPNTIVVAISMDLPFAQQRFCSIEGIDNVLPLSVFRNPEFGQQYGVLQTDGKSRGLLARAVVIIDEQGKVIYTQLVKEISQEPDYAEAIRALELD